MATISCCLGFHSQNPPCLRGHLHLFSKNFQLRIRCETHTSWNLQERLHQKKCFRHDGLLRTLLWASNWLAIVMLKKLPPEALSGMVLECIRCALVFVYLLMFSVWSSHPSSVMGWFFLPCLQGLLELILFWEPSSPVGAEASSFRSTTTSKDTGQGDCKHNSCKHVQPVHWESFFAVLVTAFEKDLFQCLGQIFHHLFHLRLSRHGQWWV